MQVTQPLKPESHGNQLPSKSFVFPFLVFRWKKKSEGCNHSTVQSVTFVLFGSRVFSIRWQGLRIMKYKMDSCPQIVYFIEHHKYKYAQILECSSSFSPFSHQLISAISKKRYVISQLTVRILTNSQISSKPRPVPSHRIRICLVRYSNGANFGSSQ